MPLTGLAQGLSVASLLATRSTADPEGSFLIFRDQTLVSELQASSFKSTIGPSLAWFDEHIRYSRLFTTSPDGGPTGAARPTSRP